MLHLFTTEGLAALSRILRQRPLLAFDFDGTLAPIVARPEDARISLAVANRLEMLGTRLPVAIVTGRSVDDVRGRLRFAPHYIVGNHGAEDGIDIEGAAARVRKLDQIRKVLDDHCAELGAVGVVIEDKGQSIALHYRLSRQRDLAVELIHRLLATPDASLHVFPGKMVVNIAPLDAPDKALAVHGLLARCGASCALFAGDDVNDEPVFVAAPPTWLTVRVGHNDPASRARFFLDGPSEMPMLLDRMLKLLPSRGAP
jgi:trehalose 6-phosphate phosphatase